jgi:hypothetical protein
MNPNPEPAMHPDKADRAPRSITAVQGCSGCGRPQRHRVKTPHGIRRVYNRLKMTLVPNVVGVQPPRGNQCPRPRKHPVYAPLCKSCRKTALDA